ncbi:MAG: Rrf2 family transcriptional regulator [Flavobacteriales bacterium]|nr:Rrf2 family transcriptional regulator [Flavobacteriales bacterium]
MLSKKAQYAFHALTYLSEHKNDGPVLISEISTERNISLKFLEHILLELKKGGILGSKKGKGGGYYLIKEEDDVPLAKVIRLIDGPIALLPCVSLHYYEACEHCDQEHCGLNKVMADVRDANLKILENKTLKDILPTS